MAWGMDTLELPSLRPQASFLFGPQVPCELDTALFELHAPNRYLTSELLIGRFARSDFPD